MKELEFWATMSGVLVTRFHNFVSDEAYFKLYPVFILGF